VNKDVLLIDKPSGWTSFDVVAKIRGMLRRKLMEKLRDEEGKRAAGAADSLRAPRDEEKPSVVPHITKRQLKVGHAGTLDPFATGLLIVLLGDATKSAGDFLKLDKVYEATIKLGAVSTTGDPEGEITIVSDTTPTPQRVLEALDGFRGEIRQRPPMYSAIKIKGQRAYDLARAGKEFEIPERIVTIYDIELLDYAYPEIKIRTHVSSGTYIRTLAEDVGKALETGAYCSELRRTRIGEYSVAKAVSIEHALGN
jgi:tRNA pseudouridine55 synthase